MRDMHRGKDWSGGLERDEKQNSYQQEILGRTDGGVMLHVFSLMMAFVQSMIPSESINQYRNAFHATFTC